MTLPNQRDPLAVILRKRGVKSSSNSVRDLQFVGKDANRTFREVAVELAGRFTVNTTDVAQVGEFYKSSIYEKTPGSSERDYEDVFADVDWSVVAEDPLAKQALLDAFGDNANDESGEKVDVESLRTILGKAKTAPAVNGLNEIQLGLVSAQNGTAPQPDEDTRGIRGVDDVDAPIETMA
jgi:hypothetical protein